MTRASSRGSAFTLVEALLLLAIAAVLVLLLAPAVQKARETSRCLACQNNLRQVGLALLRHHDQCGAFPTAGGYGGESAYLVQTQDLSGRYSVEVRAGVGHPGRFPDEQPGSWAYAVWPFLDAGARPAAVGPTAGQDVRLPMLLCPSRGRPALQTVPASDPVYAGIRYAAVPEAAGPWACTDYAGNALALPRRGQGLLRAGALGGGTACTILLGEKAMDPQAYVASGWHWDGPAFAGGMGTSRSGTLVVRDHVDPSRAPNGFFANNWGSAHADGAPFLFADGSVRLRPHGSGGATLLWLLTPAHQGGESEAEVNGL